MEDDKKDGLLKRLSDIGGKNEEQLKVIKYQGENQLKAIKDQGENQLKVIIRSKLINILRLKSIFSYSFNKKGEALFKRLIHLENTIDYNKLRYTSGNQGHFNFYEFESLVDLYQRLANDRITPKKADLKLKNVNAQITILMNRKTLKYYYVIKIKETLDNTRLLY